MSVFQQIDAVIQAWTPILRVLAVLVAFAVWVMAGFVIQVQHRPVGWLYAGFAVLVIGIAIFGE